ncbi:MAG TPA: hypothetical protein DCY30_02390, partial [Acidimicrobiaceae bacterium]|nr:hypothetical protein [Acidimicrobiaceae bacterium]
WGKAEDFKKSLDIFKTKCKCVYTPVTTAYKKMANQTGSGGSIETRVGSAIGKYERPSEQV